MVANVSWFEGRFVRFGPNPHKGIRTISRLPRLDSQTNDLVCRMILDGIVSGCETIWSEDKNYSWTHRTCKGATGARGKKPMCRPSLNSVNCLDTLHCDAEARFLEFGMLSKGNGALSAIAFASKQRAIHCLPLLLLLGKKAMCHRPLHCFEAKAIARCALLLQRCS